MRDPNRIDKFCDELKTIWHQVPDWRFSQLMSNILIAWKNQYHSDAFFVEDEKFFKFAYNFIEELMNS